MRRIGTALLLSSCLAAQSGKPEPNGDVLFRAEIVAGNIQKAITAHATEDSEFVTTTAKQLPEDSSPPPKVLITKDEHFIFDQTDGQQARMLMEEIRQGLYALRSAKRKVGMDSVAFAGGQEYWPKLRDISCRERPGIRYYDLGGLPQYCPSR